MTTPRPSPPDALTRRALLGAVTGSAAALATNKPTSAGQETSTDSGPIDFDARLAAMSTAEQAAHLFTVPVAGTILTAEEDAWLRAAKPGGVILTGANMGTQTEIAALVAAIRATNPDLPPFVCVDQEGGIVSRVPGDPAPDAPTLGALRPEEIAALAAERARFLAGFGFDVNFAPVADIAWSPDSFMAGRCFGSDPQTVATAVGAYLDGVAGIPVHHCAKHFPGHGRPTIDSHLALPEVVLSVEEWSETDGLPFAAAVDAGVALVMMGHLRFPNWDDLPTSISPVAVGVLRDQLGFGGVVVSDDLGMGALSGYGALEVVELAIAAGNDMLLYVTPALPPADLIAHLVALVEAGAIAPSRIAESARRILALKAAGSA